MKTQADESSGFDRAGTARGVVKLLIGGTTVILFSTAGVARMMGWGENSTDDSRDNLALDRTAAVPTTSEPRANLRCSECGVIVSMREIQRHDEDSGPGAAGGVTAGNRDEMRATSTRSYEIIVRMADGSRRVIHDANPASWRIGEGLIVIGGVKPSNR